MALSGLMDLSVESSMPSEKIVAAREAIENYSELVNLLDFSEPYSYSALKEFIIKQDLREQYLSLRKIFFREGDIDEIREEFHRYLHNRLTETYNSDLSIFSMPTGDVNTLLFQLIKVIFLPQNLNEFLSIVAPDVDVIIIADVDEHLPDELLPRHVRKNAHRNIGIHLEEQSLRQWGEAEDCSESFEDISKFLVVGEKALNLEDIEEYDLTRHLMLYHLLEHEHPAIFKDLYERNGYFKALKDDLLTYEGKGQTLKEYLHSFINHLILGGESLTGEEFASSEVEYKCFKFRSLLDKLPTTKTARIYQLQGEYRTSIDGVLSHLEAGNCIEEAAGKLKSIILNPQNQETLDESLSLSATGLKMLLANYKGKNKKKAVLQEQLDRLPERKLRESITRLKVFSEDELICLHLNFPTSLYDTIWQEVDMSAIYNPAHLILESMEMGLFNLLQSEALSETLLKRMLNGNPDEVRFSDFVGVPSLLGKYLESFSQKERWDLIKAAIKKEKFLANVAYFPESLRVVLGLLSKRQKKIFIRLGDEYGLPILHHAANANYQSLDLVLSHTPLSEQGSLVKRVDKHDRAAIHLSESGPHECFMRLWSYYDDEERLRLVREKGDEGKTLIHLSLKNVANLAVILSILPESKQKEALLEKNNEGLSAVTLSYLNADLLKFVLEKFEKKERLNLISEEIQKGDSALTRLFAESVEVIDQFLSLLNDADKLAVFKQNRLPEGSTFLHDLVDKEGGLEVALKYFEKERQREILQFMDLSGISCFQKAACTPKNLQYLKRIFSPEECLTWSKLTLQKGNTALHIVARKIVFHAAEAINALLSLYPVDERLPALLTKNESGNTVVSYLSISPHTLEHVLRAFNPLEQYDAIRFSANPKEQTLLMHAAKDFTWSIDNILRFIPAEEQFNEVTQKDVDGNSALHWGAKNAENLKKLLSFYPKESQSQALKEKNNHDESVLYLAGFDKESVEFILEFYSPDELYQALTEKNKTGQSVLSNFVYSPEVLLGFFQKLPESSRFKFLSETYSNEKKGDSVFHSIALTEPNHLNSFLSLLTEEECRLALSIKNKEGDTPLLLLQELEFLGLALSHIPERDWHSVVDLKNCKGETLLMKVASQLPALKFILNCYPSRMQTDALLAQNNKGESLLHLIPARYTGHFDYVLTKISMGRSESLKEFSGQQKGNSFVNFLEEVSKTSKLKKALFQKDNLGNTPLCSVATHKEALKALLDKCPKSQRCALICQQNALGETVLHRAAKKDECLQLILGYLSEKECLEALLIKTNDKSSVIRKRHQAHLLSPATGKLNLSKKAWETYLWHCPSDFSILDLELRRDSRLWWTSFGREYVNILLHPCFITFSIALLIGFAGVISSVYAVGSLMAFGISAATVGFEMSFSTFVGLFLAKLDQVKPTSFEKKQAQGIEATSLDKQNEEESKTQDQRFARVRRQL